MEEKKQKKDESVIRAGYKALGMTQQEIEKLLKIYPPQNATKQQKGDYLEVFLSTIDDVSYRRDTKRVFKGLSSGLLSLSLLSIARAAHTCNSPKTMWTCIGLGIIGALYSYYNFNNIGTPQRNEAKKVKKAEEKAQKKLLALSQKKGEQTRSI